MRIVMIEDEARIASFVKSGLESEGFLVEHADDGAAGLELVLDTDPDLVILDLILPRMGGEEVLRRLRGAGKTIPSGRWLQPSLGSMLSSATPPPERRMVTTPA